MSVNIFKKNDNSLKKIVGNVDNFHYLTNETFTGRYWIEYLHCDSKQHS